MSQKFSLILGGWAARGLAHIGVIRRIEELSLTPSFVAGTSMGALIAALYACGYTSTDMEKIATDVTLIRLVDVDMKNWGIKWKKVQEFLKKYFWEKEFKDANIALKIIATDLDTGNKIVFSDGKIIDALRASISIPWVFTPYAHDDMHLIDGWVVANLPVEESPVDIPVIAVSVQIYGSIPKTESILPFIGKWPFANTYDVLRKTLQIIMSKNEELSLKSRDSILTIRIGRNEIDYYEFTKVEELIQEGYEKSETIAWFLLK